MIGKLHGVNIGMSCIIETFNGQYIATSLLPLSTNSLCYGSNSIGTHIAHNDRDVEKILPVLMNSINLKSHVVSQLCDEEAIEVALPYSLEVHRYCTSNAEKYFLLHLPYKLWVKYETETYLRPEIMTTYSTGETDPTFVKFTWKDPVKCNECNQYIIDYDFLSYERSVNNTRTTQYFCCLACFAILSPKKGFKVPFDKLVQNTLPESMRKVYWRNMNTGEVTSKPPTKRVAFNPDAFDTLSFADPNKSEDQVFIDSLFNKIRHDLVDNLIAELNINEEYMLIDAEHLGRLAHNKGINIRFLGRLALKASCSYVREIACVLIISRGIKRLVLNALDNLKDDQDPKDIILLYLNHLLSLVDTTISRNLWQQLTQHIQSHWILTIDKSVLNRIHIPSLTIAVCKQLKIYVHNLFDVNYMLMTPFEKSKLIMLPSVLDEVYPARSLDLIVSKALVLNKEVNTEDREEGLKLMEKGLQVAATIYQKNSLQYADTALEYAKYLQAIHETVAGVGNPKWYTTAKIAPSKFSEAAEFYYEEAMNIYMKEELSHRKLIECLVGLAKLSAIKNVSVRINF